MDSISKRSLEEAWKHHVSALIARDVDAFARDFAEDCLVINNPKGGHASGVYRGRDGVRKWCDQFFTLFADVREIVAGPPFMVENVALAQWRIDGSRYRVLNGVDTFVIENGLFRLATCVYEAFALVK